MKFIIDAQLPRRLCYVLRDAGYDVIHTLDLPQKNKTQDQDILALARQEERIVVTKDSDFVDAFILRGEPERLLLISTGNINNNDLQALVLDNLFLLEEMFEVARFVELNRTNVVVRA